MKNGGAVFGGIIVLLGVFLSLFIEELGWYNWDLIISRGWINSFGGSGVHAGSDIDYEYFPEDIIDMLSGILAVAGGLLLLTRSRGMCILGAIIVLVGCGIFLYDLAQNNFLNNLADYIADGNWFWNEKTVINITYYMRIGYGWIMTGAGGIIGLIGGRDK